MDLVYMITAAVGSTILIAQVVLQLVGLGGEAAGMGELELHDGHVDGDFGDHGDLADLDGGSAGETNLFFGLLSFKTLSAFTAFFGLAGLAAGQFGIESGLLRLVLATLAGMGAGVMVMLMMRMLVGLHSSGTARLEDVVGRSARVYLRIPGQASSAGKITVTLGNREVEVSAITPGSEIPTGATVEVTRRIDGDTFEVIRL